MTSGRADADLLVVGGGPAGWAVAIRAAQAGWTVRLAEPRDSPVDKACGEGLLPSAVDGLRRLGVTLAGEPLRGIRYLTAEGDRTSTARFRAAPGLGVRRPALSSALATRGEEAGVEVIRSRVEAVQPRPEHVETRFADGSTATTQWLVAADGLHSPVRRRLGLDPPPRSGSRFGLRRHYRLAAGRPAGDLVQVFWAGDGEAYLTPVGAGVVNVALLGRPGRTYDEALQNFPALGELLREAEPVSAVRGAGPLRQAVVTRRRGRVLLAGDAAGYVDALTGEGVGAALAGAAALVECLLCERPARYDAAWARATRRQRWSTQALLAATSRPMLRRALVPMADRLPRVFEAAVDRLA